MSMTWQFMLSFLKSRAGRRARSGMGSPGRSMRIATGNVCGRMYVASSRSAVLTSIIRLGRDAWTRGEWGEAARQWSRAVTLQPDNAYFNYMRASALARLGHRQAAGEGLELALLLRPGEPLEHQIRSELATLSVL